MNEILIPFFGTINPGFLANNYRKVIQFKERELSIDLNFYKNETSEPILLAIKSFLENLDKWVDLNQKYIDKDYVSREYDSVKEYLEHHLAESDTEELAAIVNMEDEKTAYVDQLKSKLHLTRLGLYPEEDEHFAIFDYSIGKAYTQYVLVIIVDKNGQLKQMTMES